jgi:lysophospholipase L1-like esterase
MSRGKKAALVAVYALILCALFEGGSRLALALRGRGSPARAAGSAGDAIDVEAAGRALGLNPYEIADARRAGQWRLRPGSTLTLQQVLDAKEKEGRILAVRYLRERAPRLGVKPQDIVVRINSDGYRGPEINRGHGQFRILAIGDSCTFGTLLPPFGYPRALERELRRRGVEAEVINAGVEGYGPWNVLQRMDDFKALRPDLATLYIGWNALYGETFLDDISGARRYLYSARLAGLAYGRATRLVGDPRSRALQDYERPRRPDPQAPEIRALDDYTPSFLGDIERIGEALQAAGSRVVLLTLPGLYATDEAPSPRALEVGHLPTFTDNPYVLARMAGRYNEALRALGERRGLQVVDLEAWSRKALRPPEDHFFDSVHLYEASQDLLAAYLSRELAIRAPLSAPGSRGSDR